MATFAGPPPFNQTLWPDHCVQGTEGAELHPDLEVKNIDTQKTTLKVL